MTKQLSLKQIGVVEEVLPDSKFRVRTSAGIVVLSSMSGHMRKAFIKINIGDQVDLEVSPYDLYRGRIVYRKKKAGTDNFK